MTDRTRLGPPPRRTMGAGASWLVGIFAAVVLVRLVSTGSLPVSGALGGLLVLALWAVLWWRVRRRGVYVNASRVWVCDVFVTRSFGLGAVASVDTVPSGRPSEHLRRLVFHVDDRNVAAPLRGYVRGHDDPSGRLDVLPAKQFDLLLNDLRMRVATARPA
ncbi:hypothetical protein [Actinophytocola sp.]|uniref:hypothetical protein n=1 Tax=Actinophytocola sp. TaxID=1872138 RepID=UPI003D6BEAB4